MPAWPASLPQRPRRSGYVETPPDIVTRTPMSYGPAKLRPKFGTAIRVVRCSIGPLTAAQKADLDTFYRTTTQQGTIWWDWVHPRTGAAVQMRFMSGINYSAASTTMTFAHLSLGIGF